MKKLIAIGAALFMLLLVVPAQAKDLNGRMGIGGATTALHPGGLSVRYFVGHLGFQGIFSLGITSPEDEDVDEGIMGRTTSLNVARVIFNAARSRDTNMYLAGGVGLGILSLSDEPEICELSEEDRGGMPIPPGLCSSTQFGMEVAVGAEHFFTNHFSVSAEVGVPINLVGEMGGVFLEGAPQGSYIGFGQHVKFGAAFSFIF